VLASLGQSDITDEKLQSMFDTMDEVNRRLVSCCWEAAAAGLVPGGQGGLI
jgi:hypothetical protein